MIDAAPYSPGLWLVGCIRSHNRSLRGLNSQQRSAFCTCPSVLICGTTAALLWDVWMCVGWVCYSLLHARDLVNTCRRRYIASRLFGGYVSGINLIHYEVLKCLGPSQPT